MAPRVIVEYAPTTKAIRKLILRLPINVQLASEGHARFAAKRLRSVLFKPYPGPLSEDRSRTHLYERTGRLKRSIRASKLASKMGAAISAGKGITDGRASANEFGAIVRGTPFVEVPLPAALTAKTGQRRAGMRSVAEALANGAFMARSKSGNRVVLRKSKKGIEALYVLKSFVIIPARFNFFHTFRTDTEIVHNRTAVMVAAVRTAIRESFS